MIEETAVVVSCDGELAEVETERSTACGACAAGQGCAVALLARVFGNRRSRMRVANPILARPGERVVVGVRESGLVTAALVLYMLPLLSLILFALLGQMAAARFDGSGGEWPGILAGLFGLAAGLFLARQLGRSAKSKFWSRPVILRREGLPDLAVTLGGQGQPR